ncbi:hypothetical protein GWI33_006084 [Rhynchophorus ferrugineus]|uniref:Uncharacterized protein n=1 Tax=Rhynchophorus ferrugineus TaxID=354439 RepID=A0A834MDB8_RHYFE|nr:hypothetical protein GWI33_006084 [Rhynchophorus ferrugineus]
MTTGDSERSGCPKDICLKMIKRNKPEFLHRHLTTDETWLHHFSAESNRQSPEWTAHDEPATRRGKTQQTAGLAPSDYFLFSDLKRMLAGKKFSSNEEMIAETEAYFQGQIILQKWCREVRGSL